VTFERSGSFLSRIERIVAPTPAQADAAAVAAPEDDATDREIDAVVAVGDESRDPPGAAPLVPEPIPSSADIQRLVSGLIVQRTANGGLVIEAPPETASTLAARSPGWRSFSRPPPSRRERLGWVARAAADQARSGHSARVVRRPVIKFRLLLIPGPSARSARPRSRHTLLTFGLRD
jgi:hypothetical protein